MLDFGFYNMDCMDGMKEFPDNYFDLAVVDPPYGDGEGRGNDQIRADSAECSIDTSHAGGVQQYTDSETRGRGANRTGGTWAAKFGKKLFRGMLRQEQNILKSCFASHEIR